MIVIDEEELLALLRKTNDILSLLNNLRALFGPSNSPPDSPTVNGKLNLLVKLSQEIISEHTAQNTVLAEIQSECLNIGMPQQAGSTVTIDPVSLAPTAGYVWSDGIGPSGESAASVVNYAGSVAYQSVAALSSGVGSYYFRPLDVNLPMTLAVSFNWPVFIPVDILAGENLLDNLRRQNPGAVVSWYDNEGGHAQVKMPVVDQQNNWVSIIDQAEFDRIQYWAYTPSSGPPARSTLGDTNQVLSLIPLQYG